MSEEHIEASLDAYEDFKAAIMPRTRAAIRQLISETLEVFKASCRIEYLKQNIAGIIAEAWRLMDRYETYCRRDRVIERLLTGEEIQAKTKEIIKAQAEIISLRIPEKAERRVSEDAIRRAREYPFGNLVEFQRNKAQCPFHEDKSPSMHLYEAENRLHCFSCGKGWDPIAFLQEKEGLSFPEAVRRLQ